MTKAKSDFRKVRSVLRMFGDSQWERCGDRLEDRRRFAAKVANCSEDGNVAVVYGGIDCDGAMWDNCTIILPAIPTVVNKWIDDYMRQSEGRQWADICPVSESPTESQQRDLAMEAHECGHPHSLRM